MLKAVIGVGCPVAIGIVISIEIPFLYIFQN
jgi:hypothetical protein